MEQKTIPKRKRAHDELDQIYDAGKQKKVKRNTHVDPSAFVNFAEQTRRMLPSPSKRVNRDLSYTIGWEQEWCPVRAMTKFTRRRLIVPLDRAVWRYGATLLCVEPVDTRWFSSSGIDGYAFAPRFRDQISDQRSQNLGGK